MGGGKGASSTPICHSHARTHKHTATDTHQAHSCFLTDARTATGCGCSRLIVEHWPDNRRWLEDALARTPAPYTGFPVFLPALQKADLARSTQARNPKTISSSGLLPSPFKLHCVSTLVFCRPHTSAVLFSRLLPHRHRHQSTPAPSATG